MAFSQQLFCCFSSVREVLLRRMFSCFLAYLVCLCKQDHRTQAASNHDDESDDSQSPKKVSLGHYQLVANAVEKETQYAQTKHAQRRDSQLFEALFLLQQTSIYFRRQLFGK